MIFILLVGGGLVFGETVVVGAPVNNHIHLMLFILMGISEISVEIFRKL